VLEDRLREQLRNVALLDRSRELVAIAAEVQAQSVEICEHSRETIIRVRRSADQRVRPPA
jgi:hypothetical protein